MPGRVHEHDGIRVYHRKDGALRFHGRKHSRYLIGRDIKRRAAERPEKRGYPQAGDGRPKRRGKDKKLKKR